jgi:hypothetical protein
MAKRNRKSKTGEAIKLDLDTLLKTLEQNALELPTPTVIERGKPGGPWTEADVREIVCNPVYAGITPYPPTVSDKTWVAAAVNNIQQEGAAQFLVNMLTALRSSMAAVNK